MPEMVPCTTGINTVSMVNSRYYVAIAICVDVLPVPESDILLDAKSAASQRTLISLGRAQTTESRTHHVISDMAQHLSTTNTQISNSIPAMA